jgi:hypothetical protein
LIDAMLEQTRWFIPHHLQILFHEVLTLAGVHDPRERVSKAFTSGIGKRTYYEHWNERLGEELSPTDARHARAMLEVAAKDPAGVAYTTLSASIADEVRDARTRQETVLRIAHALEEDGYVEKADDRWRFRSEMLRAFWRQRYVP